MLEGSESQDTDARNKNFSFFVELSSTNAVLLIEILWRKWNWS